VSFVPLAAQLIRQVVIDENYRMDLERIVSRDEEVARGLILDSITDSDLGWLTPNQWRWFASWRQSKGGGLDPTLLDYLTETSLSRTSRFQLRGLVMRDRDTVRGARDVDAALQADGVVAENTGLRWLRSHAIEYPNSIEVARDELQFATDAAWFTLRALTGLSDERGPEVSALLLQFARSRQLPRELIALWGVRDE
jgi:hypothetical protein